MYKQTKPNQAKLFPASQQIKQICKFCGKQTTNLIDLNISLTNLNVSFVMFLGYIIDLNNLHKMEKNL